MATTTTTAVNPTFEIAKPNIQHQVTEARNIYEGGAPGYYPGQTVAALTPEQLEAMKLQLQASQQQSTAADTSLDAHTVGQSGIQQSVDTLSQIAAGKGPIVDAITGATTAGINQAWGAGGGAFGSARHSNAIGSAVGNALSQQALSAAQSLGNLSATYTGMTPTVQDAQTVPGETIESVGQKKQAQNQVEIDAAIDKYNYNANLPSQWLKNYISLTPGSETSSGTTSETSDTKANTFEKLLGIGTVLGAFF